MADEIKKVPEEVKENIENAQEGAISDDAVEAVAGGDMLQMQRTQYHDLKETPSIKPGTPGNRPR